MLYMRCPAASCPGFRRCHSSMRSLKHFPGMPRGIQAPFDRIILPCWLRRHFPALIYSVATKHSREKCPGLLPKLQLVLVCGRRTGHSVRAFTAMRALTKESVIRSTIAAISSVFISVDADGTTVVVRIAAAVDGGGAAGCHVRHIVRLRGRLLNRRDRLGSDLDF